ncbi:MAG: hypothetical protein A2Z77_03995 [Chloroflexi bacterium RBG_13_51_36]|nr:MAG: hypothetical protein A2Z77_03995 [Chloroflexi bacterium RBG_13_51_36]
MRKRFPFVVYLAIGFVALSAILYFVHYLVFRDIHHIFIYLLGDLAFLPLEVLLVVIIIERVLARREMQAKLEKLNMVMGAFFSEIGNRLLRDLLTHFDNREDISSRLNVAASWTKKDFRKADRFAYQLRVEVDCRNIDLGGLKALLEEKREFLLTLLENPSLLEHDRFTDLLWAVTHLDEELAVRTSLIDLPEKDLEHLAGDVRRLYDHLASEWLDYVQHLKSKYPFLFSLVLRTHPFQEHQSPVIT